MWEVLDSLDHLRSCVFVVWPVRRAQPFLADVGCWTNKKRSRDAKRQGETLRFTSFFLVCRCDLQNIKPITMSGLLKVLDPFITKAAQLYRAQLAKDLNKMGTLESVIEKSAAKGCIVSLDSILVK